MKTIYFVRHGESELNKSRIWAGTIDTPLTDLGHEQAKTTGKALKEKGLIFDVIVASPLVRAHETAKHVAREIGHDEKKIILDPMLVERHFGIMEGQLAGNEDHEVRYYAGDESAIDTVENVETSTQLQARARHILTYLDSLPHDTILVVAHGALARALRREINGEPHHVRGQDYENAEIVRLI